MSPNVRVEGHSRHLAMGPGVVYNRGVFKDKHPASGVSLLYQEHRIIVSAGREGRLPLFLHVSVSSRNTVAPVIFRILPTR